MVSSPGSAVPGSADAVVVGGGTVGAWCAYFLRKSGLADVVLLEKDTLGQGASSRAAGVIRTQGGTPWAVRLGEWSRLFYLSQASELGVDSGFIPHGYVLPCFSAQDVQAAKERMAMQNGLGLRVRWLEPDEVDELNPSMAPGKTLGATYCAQDGYLHPPRNVIAYSLALATSGVRVCERTAFTGLDVASGVVTGVRTSAGVISAPLVVLTGGPDLADVGALAGIAIPAGAVRHQVAVTEPHPDLAPSRLPMVFDLSAGLYWRPEEGGMLFGMSNPERAAGRGPQRRRGVPGPDPQAAERAGPGDRRTRAAPNLGSHHRLHAGPPADHRSGEDLRSGRQRGHRGQCRRRRDDVGSGSGQGGGRPGADRNLASGRHDRPRPGPVRRARPKPPGDRPDRAALPRARRQPSDMTTRHDQWTRTT